MKRRLLTFCDERKHKIEMIVLHSVALSPKDAIESFCQYNVASHYVIAEDGEIWQLVGQKKRAWHAGKSKWHNMDDINSRSIGIEFCSQSLGQKPFSEAQQKAGLELVAKLVKKYKILPQNIVAHSDIAPTRKADPGKAFFWEYLAENGIGLWYDLSDCEKIAENDVAKLLETIGYDVSNVKASAYAFCRRFYPEKVATVDDVWQIEKKVFSEENDILNDDMFIKILKAVAYRYLNASKTPSSM